jgi:UDP-N-acetyl-D-mannosaminuronate dehydrogenase
MSLLNRHRKALNGSRVLVLGLSYKAGTSDWRESPSIAVVERLQAMGADVRACEPYIPRAGAHALPAPVVDCTPAELAAADLVVLLVDHIDFPLDEVAEHAPLVLDTKGVMRPREFTGETL